MTGDNFHKEAYKKITGADYEKDAPEKWLKLKGWVKLNGLGYVLRDRGNYAMKNGYIKQQDGVWGFTGFGIDRADTGTILRYLSGEYDKIFQKESGNKDKGKLDDVFNSWDN